MKQVYETLGDKWDLDQPTTKLFEERLRTATPTPLDWVVIDRFERKECDNRHDKAEYTQTTHCALIDNESDSVAKALHNFSIPGLGKFDLRVSERSTTGYEPCYGLRIRESSILRLLHASARCSRKYNAGSRHLAVFPLVLGCVQGKR